MALKTFEHVLILADDVDKTKDFYVELNKVQLEMRNASFSKDTLLLSDLNSV